MLKSSRSGISHEYGFFQIVDAIISHGCFLGECSVEHSIVGVRSRLDNGVELKVKYIYNASAN